MSNSNPTNEVTLDEAMRLMERMAQDLRDYLKAAEEGGSDIASTRQLLAEYEELHRRSPFSWLTSINDNEPDAPGISNL